MNSGSDHKPKPRSVFVTFCYGASLSYKHSDLLIRQNPPNHPKWP